MPTLQKPQKSQIVSIKMDIQSRERLGNLANIKQRTAHYLMREAINQYLIREEARASFIASAKASWEEYNRTGSHITLDEFDLWANTLEKNPNTLTPACHT